MLTIVKQSNLPYLLVAMISSFLEGITFTLIIGFYVTGALRVCTYLCTVVMHMYKLLSNGWSFKHFILGLNSNTVYRKLFAKENVHVFRESWCIREHFLVVFLINH